MTSTTLPVFLSLGKIGNYGKTRKNNFLYAESTEKRHSHAEQNVLKKLFSYPHKVKKVIMIVLRLSGKGNLGESRPCIDCVKKWIRCYKQNIWIYFSTTDNKTGEIIITKERLFDMINSDKTYVSSGNRCCEWRKK